MNLVPTEIAHQVDEACQVLKRHLADICAIYLYGSAIEGGLRPRSDIDLLVVVSNVPTESIRRALMLELLRVSCPPETDSTKRALEVTVIHKDETTYWRHPARRELQFGEWLRNDLLAGIFEPPIRDNDLTILLTHCRKMNVVIEGPLATDLLKPIPKSDFTQALSKTLDLWNSPEDWAGDERNVVLTVARIWFSISTGEIVSKDRAASWLLEKLPIEHHELLQNARAAYLGHYEDDFALRRDAVGDYIAYTKKEIRKILSQN